MPRRKTGGQIKLVPSIPGRDNIMYAPVGMGKFPTLVQASGDVSSYLQNCALALSQLGTVFGKAIRARDVSVKKGYLTTLQSMVGTVLPDVDALLKVMVALRNNQKVLIEVTSKGKGVKDVVKDDTSGIRPQPVEPKKPADDDSDDALLAELKALRDEGKELGKQLEGGKKRKSKKRKSRRKSKGKRKSKRKSRRKSKGKRKSRRKSKGKRKSRRKRRK